MNRLLDGLLILKKYVEEGESIDVCAEHDIIYVGVEYKKVSKEDRKKLDKMGGWHRDEENDDCWAMFT